MPSVDEAWTICVSSAVRIGAQLQRMSRKENAKGDDVALDTRAPKDEVEEGEGQISRSDTVFQAENTT